MFWDDFYKQNRDSWGFEPSDSAIIASDLFAEKGFEKVLIPGVGYGRNAKPFLDKGMDIVGIEISQTAINMARMNNLNFQIYEGSITQMPFSNDLYDGIFSYATLHLFNTNERKYIIENCFNQLNENGIMFFNVISKKAMNNFEGDPLGNNTVLLKNNLEVFFYEKESIEKEFENYNIIKIENIEEPIKFKENEKPLSCINIICKK